jgi:hypothetical protein
MIKTPNLLIKFIRAEFKIAKEKADLVRMEMMFFALIGLYHKMRKHEKNKFKKILAKRQTEVRKLDD